MQTAPSVSVDANDGGLGRAAAAVLAGLAAAVTFRWALLWLAVPFEPLAVHAGVQLAASLVGGLLCGAWAWRRAGTGAVRLSWDGTTWRWHPGAAASVSGRARVVFDLGRWLLLAFDPDPPAQAERPHGWRGAWPLGRWTAWRGATRRWRLLDDASAHVARAALYAAGSAPRAGGA